MNNKIVDYNIFGITGISNKEHELSPEGNYLRWNFIPELGIPILEEDEKGKYSFQLFRRYHEHNSRFEKKVKLFQIHPFYSGLNRNEFTVGDLVVLSEEAFTVTPIGLITQSKDGTLLKIKFSSAVHKVKIRIIGYLDATFADESKILVYLNNKIISKGTLAQSLRSKNELEFELEDTPFDTLVIPYYKGFLREISYSTIISDCDHESWIKDKICNTYFPEPHKDTDLDILSNYLSDLLPNSLTNRFYSNSDKYNIKIKEILLRLRDLLYPDDSFINPNEYPEIQETLRRHLIDHLLDLVRQRPLHERIQYFKGDNKKPSIHLKPWHEIFLAALDPNIALMLGLMYIDEDAVYNISYDYLVRAEWKDGITGQIKEYCAIFYNLGGSASEKVPTPYISNYEILRGTSWRNGEAAKRVGLKFALSDELNLISSPSSPVFFDIKRDEGILTENEPVLRKSKSEDFDYIDTLVPVGEHNFQVRGIDLFGRVSNWSESTNIDVFSDEVPPPPIRVSGEIIQPWLTQKDKEKSSEDNTLKIGWEWRYFQHIQRPLVNKFKLYSRSGSLVDTFAIKVTRYETLEDGNNKLKITLSSSDMDTNDLKESLGIDISVEFSEEILKKFVGGTLSKITSDGKLPSVKERANYTLSNDPGDINGNTIVILESPSMVESGLSERELYNQKKFVGKLLGPVFEIGDYLLHSNPRNKESGWEKLNEYPISQPINGEIKSSVSLKLNVKSVQADSPEIPDLIEGKIPYIIKFDPPQNRNLFIMQLLQGQRMVRSGKMWKIISNLAYSKSLLREELELDNFKSISQPSQIDIEQTDLLNFVVMPDSDHDEQPASNKEYEIPGLLNISFEPGSRVTSELLTGGQLAIPAGISNQLNDGNSWNNNKEYSVFDIVSGYLNARTNVLDFWVKAPSKFSDYSINNLTAYLFSPYQELIDPCPDDLLPNDNNPLKVGYIAMSAVVDASSETDNKELESPLSPAVQVIALKAPPNTKPGSPYPEPKRIEDINQDYFNLPGYATPPDYHGKSFFSLKWDTLSDDLNYEVYRALDRSIIKADHDNWQLKQGHYDDLSDTSNILLYGDVIDIIRTSIDLQEVTVVDVEEPGDGTVLFSVDLDEDSMDKYIGGAFEFGGNRFPIIAIFLEESQIDIRTRKRINNESTGYLNFPGQDDSITLHPSPKYEEILKDDELLRIMSDLSGNAKAFNLVTTTPVSGNTFTDLLPGKGRNRFFYRIRGLDSAGNRTPWSDTSVPVYLVDTTPPAKPSSFRAIPDDRSAVLVWPPPIDPQVEKYHIYRLEGGNNQFDRGPDNYRVLQLNELSPKKLKVIYHGVGLPRPLEHIIQEETIVSLLDAADSSPNLFITTSELTSFDGRVIRQINPLVPNGTPIRVVIDKTEGSIVLTRQPGSEIELLVNNGEVNLNFDLNISAIEFLLSANLFSESTDLEQILSFPNVLDEDSVTIDVDDLKILGLDSLLPEGSAVVAIVRLDDNTLRAIRYSPGRDEPLTIQNGQVDLDMDFSNSSLIGVHRKYEDSNVDLRLIQTSAFELDHKGFNSKIKDLNPLVPDNTSVKIIIKTLDNNILIFDSNPALWTWVNDGIEGGIEYTYYLAAVKKVRYKVQTSGDQTSVLEIQSAFAGPVSIIGLDRSIPEPPIILEANWIDLITNDAAMPETENPVSVRLVVQCPSETSQIRIQRQNIDNKLWNNVSLTAGKGWLEWEVGVNEVVFSDENADPSQSWSYRGQLRTVDDRMSCDSGIKVITALKSGGDK